MRRLDIGSGRYPRAGFVSVDSDPGVCPQCLTDLNKPGCLSRFFELDSVDEVWSSHCLEHLTHVHVLLREMVKVCKLGAPVTIIVPHWLNPLSFTAGHVGAISEDQVRHWREFPEVWWGDSDRWFSTPLVLRNKSARFDAAKRTFPTLTEEQLLEFVPGTCFDVRFSFVVEERPL